MLNTLSKLKAALLLPAFLSAYNLNSEIVKHSEDKYWKILLHYKKGKSEIDSPNFFISKNGKYSLKDELNATINRLINPKKQGDESVYCRFPARREWIKKTFKINIKPQNCPELNKELNAVKNISSVSIIFPTILMNSPASMFGHTLLRLDEKNGDLLNSFAINYAAQTNETNGLIYAFKGLTGGYIGKYAILPYYKKIAEYNDIKNRDIWEYKLNLTKPEIERLKLHLYEIKNTWSYYYYFNKNCSYEILWLLEAARPSLEVIYKFNLKTLPVDTLKELKNENEIVSSNFRPSQQKIILNYFNKIKHKNIALKFNKTHNFKLIKNLTTTEKIYILDFSIEMLRYNYLSKKIKREKYLKEYISLLKKRSSLPKEKPLKIKPPQNPLISHDSNKIWIYAKKDNFIIGIKPAFHNIDDINNGFIPGAYIDFFNLQAQIGKDSKLNHFYFFEINSLTPRNRLFKPISWSVNLGFERFKDNKMYADFKAGAYFTYKFSSFLYSFGINLKDYQKDKNYFGYSPTIYFENNFKNSKIYLKVQRNFFNFKKFNEIESMYIYRTKRNFSLNIGYKKDINSNYFFTGFSLYFL
ncbi:Lnb N-terminal periplasmic domain-containing protein [Caminibacter sp.]